MMYIEEGDSSMGKYLLRDGTQALAPWQDQTVVHGQLTVFTPRQG